MGMSASQARYLQLTARKSNVEFEVQQICQQRLSLAERTQQIATKYADATNDRRLMFNSPLSSNTGTETAAATRLTYSDIVRDQLDENPGMGMRIVNTDGKIIAPYIPEGESANDYVIDLNCLSSDYLENKLRNAEWIIQKPVNTSAEDQTVSDIKWEDVSIYSNTNITDALYTDNDSAAVAEYKRDSETIQSQDKALELRVQQLTTEQKSLETEIDSVNKVLNKNIETSFKTFG